MRMLFLCLGLTLAALTAQGQADTTIYQVVSEMPRFPACERLDTTLAAKQQCANQVMLQYVYERIVYPQQAINEGIEGTAVVTFVIEADGALSQPRIVRDLGAGTGMAALAVVLNMMEEGIRWVPGKLDGRPVRVQFTLPIRFKLEDPLPYSLVGRDTVYTQFDTELSFQGGAEGLQAFMDKALVYPETGNADCGMGQIDIQVLVENTGRVRVLDVTDYNELGFDFWYAAIHAATSTQGQWTPATYQGRAVNTAFDLSLSFMPTDAGCKTAADLFIRAHDTANEGTTLINAGDTDQGFAKLTEAVTAFPDDAQLRILRGQAYLNQNQLPEACADLSIARRVAMVNWFDSILELICR